MAAGAPEKPVLSRFSSLRSLIAGITDRFKVLIDLGRRSQGQARGGRDVPHLRNFLIARCQCFRKRMVVFAKDVVLDFLYKKGDLWEPFILNPCGIQVGNTHF